MFTLLLADPEEEAHQLRTQMATIDNPIGGGDARHFGPMCLLFLN